MICKKCAENKDDHQFYANDKTCKECRKKMVRDNRLKNIEYYREYDKKRFKEDPKVLARHKLYQKTEAGIESMRKARTKWQENNQEKRAAHVLLGNAVRDGKVTKPDKCQKCGSGGRIHGHHDDYTKPLDVIWVCPTCHNKIHEND